MPSLPMFVNVAGSAQAGADAEEKRRYDTRLQKRKDLQELSDRLAAEGRVLSPDEWFNIAQETLGPTAVLYGDAPTAAILDSVRASGNLKAEQVQRDRQFQAATRATQLDRDLRDEVMERARAGETQEDIYTSLYERDPETAKRYRGRIPAFISAANSAEERDGFIVGQQFNSIDDAKEYIKQSPYLSDSKQKGIIAQAQINQDKADSDLSALAVRVGASGGMNDSADTRELIRGSLPPWMQRSPRVGEYVDRVVKMASGAANVKTGADRYNVGNTAQMTYAQRWPDVLQTKARFDEIAQERLDRGIEDATKTAAAQFKFRSDQLTGTLASIASKSKDKALQSRVLAAEAFLKENDVVNADEIIAAASEGADKFDAAMAKARRVAVPLASIQAAERAQMEAAAGKGFTGNVQTDYANVASIGTDPAILTSIGQSLAADRQAGNMQLAQKTGEMVVNGIYAGTLKTRSTLASAGRAGQFGATSEQMAQLEQRSIEQQLTPFAKASGLPLDFLVREVLAKLPPPTAIEKRPGAGDRFAASIMEGTQQGGQMFPSGAPSAAPSNAQLPAPLRNNNPGALMPGGKLASFPTPEAGIAALDDNLKRYAAKGVNTLAGVISMWAPPTENNTAAYIADVAQRTGIKPDQPIDLTNAYVRQMIGAAIMVHESGLGAVLGAGGTPASIPPPPRAQWSDVMPRSPGSAGQASRSPGSADQAQSGWDTRFGNF